MKTPILASAGVILLLGTGLFVQSRKPLTVAPQPAHSRPVKLLADARNQWWQIEALNKKIAGNSQDADLYLKRGTAYNKLIMIQKLSSDSADYALIPEWKALAAADFGMVIRLDPENAQARFEHEKVQAFANF